MNTNNKAMKVKQAYYDAAWDGVSSVGCYYHAVNTAKNLGGIEITNSNNNNDGNNTWSYAPSMTFAFDDLSTVEITVGGVFL